MKPRVLILRGPGTNCDVETAHAFNEEGAAADTLHINQLRKKPSLLQQYRICCIPGGFTYGDDISAGKIFANELIIFLQHELRRFINKGNLILGICNGFQVLVKTGILPDMDFTQKTTLARNDSLKFEARWVSLTVEQESLWTRGLAQKVIMLPVAHGEGKFVADSTVLRTLRERKQVLFRYADKQGPTAAYPANPNGSLDAIAGITDRTGRVLGLMPHPERFFYERQHPYGTLLQHNDEEIIPWGRLIFKNAMAYIKEQLSEK